MFVTVCITYSGFMKNFLISVLLLSFDSYVALVSEVLMYVCNIFPNFQDCLELLNNLIRNTVSNQVWGCFILILMFVDFHDFNHYINVL